MLAGVGVLEVGSAPVRRGAKLRLGLAFWAETRLCQGACGFGFCATERFAVCVLRLLPWPTRLICSYAAATRFSGGSSTTSSLRCKSLMIEGCHVISDGSNMKSLLKSSDHLLRRRGWSSNPWMTIEGFQSLMSAPSIQCSLYIWLIRSIR